MRILIDIGHPAHVHYFRWLYRRARERGDDVLVIARRKDVSHALLEAYGIPFVSRGAGARSAPGKLAYMLAADALMLRHALRFRPDVFVSFSSMYAAQTAWLMRRPHIALDDTEHARLARRFYAPFTELILSPTSFRGPPLPRQRRFNGFLELLYLHPSRYAPDPGTLRAAGLEPGVPYAVVRFVAWTASHDIGARGLPLERKIQMVRRLERLGRVVISSEEALPPELEGYRVRVEPHRMHDLLAFASVFVGESATMAAESAVLGTPAVYLDRVGRGYTSDLEERFGLVWNYPPEDIDDALHRVCALLERPDPAEFAARRERLLRECEDPLRVLEDAIEEVGRRRRRTG